MPSKRAPRIAAPGAERITITGIMAASDRYDRVRIMILDERPDGKSDPSAARLRRCRPQDISASVPFELRDETVLPPNSDGVRGTCWIVLPARHKKHWLDTAAELRSRWVRAEVLVRHFAFESPEGGRHVGVALDLAMLAPLEPIS